MPKSIYKNIYKDLKKEIENITFTYQEFLPPDF